MIIGVAGTICSGKGIVSKYIGEKGFEVLSFGSVVKEAAERRGLDINRKNLQRLGDIGRREQKGIWVARLFDKIESGRKYVVDGFR